MNNLIFLGNDKIIKLEKKVKSEANFYYGTIICGAVTFWGIMGFQLFAFLKYTTISLPASLLLIAAELFPISALIIGIATLNEKIISKKVKNLNLYDKLLEFDNTLSKKTTFSIEELAILTGQFSTFSNLLSVIDDELTSQLFKQVCEKLINLLLQNKEINYILLLGFTHPTNPKQNLYFKDLYDFILKENDIFSATSGLDILSYYEDYTDDDLDELDFIKKYKLSFKKGAEEYYKLLHTKSMNIDIIALLQYLFYENNFGEIIQMEYNFDKITRLKEERCENDFRKEDLIKSLFFTRKD